ncbi:MAG: radical SAM protein [Candidatus Omnitrophica bacterium]|nr:radical SAM protein [Candidatus Omnitrophota bacterium]
MENARRLPKPPRLIIAFGPFASVFSDEILLSGLADIVVKDDPEFVIPAVLEGRSPLKTVPNISYRHEGTIIHTVKHSFPNLDEIPFIGPYFYNQGHPRAFLMTARGCQHHCVFCDRNVHWGGGLRYRSVANVLDEVRDLVENNQAGEIELLDEDFAADQKRLTAICAGMRRIKGQFFWACSACVSSVNKKMLFLMGRSACREIYFGVESASPAVLHRLGKRYSRQDILNAVRWSQEAGLKVEVMITVDNPGETEQDRNLTLSALKELGPDVKVSTNRLVILPGTALYREGLRKGWFTRQSFFEDEGLVFYGDKRQEAAYGR